MIRVILRRLIIPCGNTGSFTLPLLETAEVGDIAVLAIYDPMYKTTLKRKIGVQDNESKTVTFSFAQEDTMDIEPDDRYQWDVTIYHNPTEYDENNIPTKAEGIDSYYAAFEPLPPCEIKAAP